MLSLAISLLTGVIVGICLHRADLGIAASTGLFGMIAVAEVLLFWLCS
jgi:hypothetical protein